jgi:hypothetical protein
MHNNKNNNKNNNTQTFEFDLDKYSIQDLYNLFNLEPNTVITDEVLRKAKRILIQVHPDKSKLPKEYFMFFNKAYKILENMSIFNKQSNKSRSSEYVHDDLYEREIHETISQNKEDNNKFNTIFEKINTDLLPNNKTGYGDWLSNDTNSISIQNHDTMFQQYKKKYNITDITIYNVNPLTNNSNIGDSLIDEPTEYTSDIFSTLKYNDLKKSYEEPLFNISDEYHSKLQKYNNVDQLIQSRKLQSLNPLTQQESLHIMNNNDALDQDISTQRAYKLAKELEKSQLKNIQFTSNFFKISN